MYMTDFEFDGEMLSTHGYIVACANSATPDSIQMGSELTLNTVKNYNNNSSPLTGTSYDTVLTATFDICKDLCTYDDLELTEEEIRDIMSWLTRKQYCKFKPVYDDGSFYDLYYMGTFTNMELISKSNAGYIGFTMTLTTNAPYGWAKEPELAFENVSEFEIYNTSDELGYLYPESVVIQPLADGDLTIKHYLGEDEEEDDEVITLTNLTANEIITMDCVRNIITSDVSNTATQEEHKKFYNDFNYNWFRLTRTYAEKLNKYKLVVTTTDDTETAFPCNVTLNYSSIRKVGVLL